MTRAELRAEFAEVVEDWKRAEVEAADPAASTFDRLYAAQVAALCLRDLRVLTLRAAIL